MFSLVNCIFINNSKSTIIIPALEKVNVFPQSIFPLAAYEPDSHFPRSPFQTCAPPPPSVVLSLQYLAGGGGGGGGEVKPDNH